MNLDELMRQHSFSHEIPSDPKEKRKAFVRELVIGINQEYWGPIISQRHEGGIWIDRSRHLERRNNDDLLLAYVKQKYGENHIWGEHLRQDGYLEIVEGLVGVDYRITDKARELLNEARPWVTPKIFISYSSKYSSPFALLLAQHLKAKGVSSFIDAESLRGGDDWWERIQNTIRKVTHFVCLVREGTLGSPYVCKEIIAAKTSNPNAKILWIYHHSDKLDFGSFTDSDQIEAANILETKQGYKIMEETAREYNRILGKLIEDL